MQLMVPGPPTPNDAKSRVRQREEDRLRRAQEAMEQSHRFRSRERPTLAARVAHATHALKGRNVMDTIQLIEGLADAEREVYLLAEAEDQARKSVLSRFGPQRKSLRAEFAAQKASDAPAKKPVPDAKEKA